MPSTTLRSQCRPWPSCSARLQCRPRHWRCSVLQASPPGAWLWRSMAGGWGLWVSRLAISASRLMRISYLAENPELAEQLIPGLLEHWSYIFPNQTAAERAAKFRTHLNRDELPIAWVAH